MLGREQSDSGAAKLFDMESRKIGRALGIGVRVASKVVRERAERAAADRQTPSEAVPASAGTGSAGAANPVLQSAQRAPQPGERAAPGREKPVWGQPANRQRANDLFPTKTIAAATRSGINRSRGVGVGARRFGEAFWGPLTRAGSTLWLEITGLFFALFALFFAQNLYRVRGSWKQGTEHGHFLLYGLLMILFLWFSSSSFLRARRTSKKSS